MNAHRNARTTPYSRALIVDRHASGEAVADIAASFGISIRTVYKWLARYSIGGNAALETASSVPHRPARRIGAWWRNAAARLRCDYRMTAAEIAERLRLARSTVARWLNIRHIRTRPYTPRTNGKAERFIQTLLREWAYAIPYRSSDSRNRDLARYLDWYNTARPHYALAKQPPAKRLSQLLNNVLRNET